MNKLLHIYFIVVCRKLLCKHCMLIIFLYFLLHENVMFPTQSQFTKSRKKWAQRWPIKNGCQILGGFISEKGRGLWYPALQVSIKLRHIIIIYYLLLCHTSYQVRHISTTNKNHTIFLLLLFLDAQSVHSPLQLLLYTHIAFFSSFNKSKVNYYISSLFIISTLVFLLSSWPLSAISTVIINYYRQHESIPKDHTVTTFFI